MKAKFFFIALFATADAFLGAFAIGFNSRHALIGDPTIPAPKIEKSVPAVTSKPESSTKKTSEKTDATKPGAKANDAKSDAATKGAHGTSEKDKKGKGSKKPENGKSTKAEKPKTQTKTPAKSSDSKKHDSKPEKGAK